jgi:hypothetical protein
MSLASTWDPPTLPTADAEARYPLALCLPADLVGELRRRAAQAGCRDDNAFAAWLGEEITRGLPAAIAEILGVADAPMRRTP